MKFLYLLLFLPLISCKKTAVIQEKPADQLLVLLVGDTLEAVYEYNLGSGQMPNDSLPIFIDVIPEMNGMSSTNLWKFEGNSNPLFQLKDNHYIFFGDEVYLPPLFYLETALPYNENEFQLVGGGTPFDSIEPWKVISKLSLVCQYRTLNPTAKIGISRAIFMEFDANLNLSFPVQKHIFFIVN